jgi:hypothetical protein
MLAKKALFYDKKPAKNVDEIDTKIITLKTQTHAVKQNDLFSTQFICVKYFFFCFPIFVAKLDCLLHIEKIFDLK